MGGGWRVATRRSYGEHLSDRLCPFDLGGGLRLGDVRVRDLHGGHVEALVTGLRNGGYAPDTVRSVHRLFVTLLNRAVARGLLGRHPLDAELRKELAKHMKATKPPVKAFTEEQARRFLTVAREKSRLYPLYLTGFLAGLRLGELCGLQLDDDRWDLVNGERRRQLHVDRSLSQLCSARNPEPGPTKSGKTRTVNVANELGTLFDRIKTERPKQAMARGWRPVPPWMFVTPSNGTPFNQTNIYKDFMRMLDVAGFKEGSGFSPHSMRHSFACWHIARGCNVKWLQQQMGHASITVTLDVYGDWFKLQDHAAADALGAELVGNNLGNRA